MHAKFQCSRGLTPLLGGINPPLHLTNHPRRPSGGEAFAPPRPY